MDRYILELNYVVGVEDHSEVMGLREDLVFKSLPILLALKLHFQEIELVFDVSN